MAISDTDRLLVIGNYTRAGKREREGEKERERERERRYIKFNDIQLVSLI